MRVENGNVAPFEADPQRLERWRDLGWAEIEAAGQHELLNWICLAGAMHALGRRAEIVDWVETYVFNSSKCFAVFPCS